MKRISGKGKEKKRRAEQSWRAKGGSYLYTPEAMLRATPIRRKDLKRKEREAAR